MHRKEENRRNTDKIRRWKKWETEKEKRGQARARDIYVYNECVASRGRAPVVAHERQTQVKLSTGNKMQDDPGINHIQEIRPLARNGRDRGSVPRMRVWRRGGRAPWYMHTGCERCG